MIQNILNLHVISVMTTMLLAASFILQQFSALIPFLSLLISEFQVSGDSIQGIAKFRVRFVKLCTMYRGLADVIGMQRGHFSPTPCSLGVGTCSPIPSAPRRRRRIDEIIGNRGRVVSNLIYETLIARFEGGVTRFYLVSARLPCLLNLRLPISQESMPLPGFRCGLDFNTISGEFE